MTIALGNKVFLTLIAVLVLALALGSVVALDQGLHLGLLHALLHLPAWSNACC